METQDWVTFTLSNPLLVEKTLYLRLKTQQGEAGYKQTEKKEKLSDLI